MSDTTEDLPVAFAEAARQIRNATLRGEVTAQEIPAPERIAPHSIAVAAGITRGNTHPAATDPIDSALGAGRFVLMYDPVSEEEWGGPFRIVCFVQAPLEVEIGVDPFISGVAQSWLIDALDSRAADYDALSGTVTKTISNAFGAIASRGDSAQIELRVSWTPFGPDFAVHAEAWAELLCLLAGLPHEGVESLESRRIRQPQKRAE